MILLSLRCSYSSIDTWIPGHVNAEEEILIPQDATVRVPSDTMAKFRQSAAAAAASAAAAAGRGAREW